MGRPGQEEHKCPHRKSAKAGIKKCRGHAADSEIIRYNWTWRSQDFIKIREKSAAGTGVNRSRGSGGKQCKRNTQHCSIDDPAVFLLRIYSCMIHDLSPYPQKETGWQPLNPAFQYMFHSTKSQGSTFLSQAEFAIFQYTRITVRIQDDKPLKTKNPIAPVILKAMGFFYIIL